MLLALRLKHIFLKFRGTVQLLWICTHRKNVIAFKSMLIVETNGTTRRKKTFALYFFSFILERLDEPCTIASIFFSICKVCMALRKRVSWNFRSSSVFLNMFALFQVSMVSGRYGNASFSSFVSWSTGSLVMALKVFTFLLAKEQLSNRPLSFIIAGSTDFTWACFVCSGGFLSTRAFVLFIFDSSCSRSVSVATQNNAAEHKALFKADVHRSSGFQTLAPSAVFMRSKSTCMNTIARFSLRVRCYDLANESWI